MKRYDERLTLQSGDLGERYVDGRLNVIVKLRSRRDGQEFHLVISRGDIGLKDNSTSALFAVGGLVSRWANETVINRVNHEMGAVPVSDPYDSACKELQLLHDHAGLHKNGLNWDAVPLVSCVVMQGSE